MQQSHFTQTLGHTLEARAARPRGYSPPSVDRKRVYEDLTVGLGKAIFYLLKGDCRVPSPVFPT